MKNLSTLTKSILAGMSIGIAGTVFLRVPDQVVGSMLFGFGLLSIVCLDFKLFTGAVGYLADPKTDKIRHATDCLIIWIGNLVGTFLVGTALRATRVYATIDSRVYDIAIGKASDGFFSIFILAMFCGLLMFIAVDSWRKSWPAVVRLGILFLCVSVFILSGFEHCIANMFFYAVSSSLEMPKVWAALGMATAGNAIGGMIIPVARTIAN